MPVNVLFPIIAAVLQASSFTLDKVVLSAKRVTFRTYTGVSFPLIFLITLGIFFIFKPPLSFDLLAGNLWWLLGLSIIFSIITNLIFYRALDNDRLGEIQTIDLLGDLPVIIFAALIFTDERNVAVIFPALLAFSAIIWSHWEHNHFKIAKRTLPFLIWVLAIAPFGAAISKTLLAAWNPISLELVRSGAVALILGSLFWRQIKSVSSRAFLLLLITNLFTSIAWILFYFGYQRLGVVHTTLLFFLQPMLVYLSSLVFLREPFHRKKFIAFLIVLAAIVTVQIIK
jgi:drug/metabolite transporter (DMT)-like permease